MNFAELLERVGGPRNVGIGVAVVVALWLASKLFGKTEEASHSRPAQCGQCGWRGQVSKFKPRCAKCGQAIVS